MKQKMTLPISLILTAITFIFLAVSLNKKLDALENFDFNEPLLEDDDLF